MATEAILQSISVNAGSDLRTKQFYAVKVGTDGLAAVAGAGKNIAGILQDKPNTGQPGSVAISGVSKAVLSDTVTTGQMLEIASGGTFVPKASGTVVAQAMEGGATGNVISVLLCRANGDMA